MSRIDMLSGSASNEVIIIVYRGTAESNLAHRRRMPDEPLKWSVYDGSNYDCSVVDVGAADTSMDVPSAAVHACVAVSMRMNGAVARERAKDARLSNQRVDRTAAIGRYRSEHLRSRLCYEAGRRGEVGWKEIRRSSIEVAGLEKLSRMLASMLRPVAIVVAQQQGSLPFQMYIRLTE